MAGFTQCSMEPKNEVSIVDTDELTETSAYPMNARYMYCGPALRDARV